MVRLNGPIALAGATVVSLVGIMGCFPSVAVDKTELVVNNQASDSLSLKKTAELTLKLPAKVAAGFIWTLDKAPKACSVDEAAFEQHTGEVSYQIFRIKCTEPGAGSLYFWYGREPSDSPVKTYKLTINVTN